MKLGDFVTLQRGHDLPEHQRKPGKVPILGSFGITGYHDAPKTQGPGVTVGRSGASFGVVNYSPVDYWPLNTALYVKNFHGNDEKFAYYFLKTIDFKRFNSGSAQPSLNRNFIHPIQVRIPPLDEQKEIAYILGTLDDKFELNQQMNRTLEGIARALFKSWFIDFDPVRAKLDGRQPEGMDAETAALFPDSFEDSPLGKIPKGWKVGTLGDVCEIQGGYAYKSNDFIDSGYPVIKIKNINENTSVDVEDVQYISEDIALKTQNFWLNDGDLIMAMTGATVGKFGLVLNKDLPTLLNQRVARLCPLATQGNSIGFIFFALLQTNLTEQVFSIAEGSAQPNISASGIMSARMVIPQDELIRIFNQTISTVIQKILGNRKESRYLITVRDALLPRLLSGEIKISSDLNAITETLYA